MNELRKLDNVRKWLLMNWQATTYPAVLRWYEKKLRALDIDPDTWEGLGE